MRTRNEEVLRAYEELEVITRDLELAAANEHYDEMGRLGKSLDGVLATLEHLDPIVSLTSAEKARKKELIVKALSANKRASDLIEPKIQALQQMLQSSEQQRKVDKAYAK